MKYDHYTVAYTLMSGQRKAYSFGASSVQQLDKRLKQLGLMMPTTVFGFKNGITFSLQIEKRKRKPGWGLV